MGFFSQLGDIWSDWGAGKSWDLLGDAWGKTKDSMKAYASGLYGLASAPFSDKATLKDAFIQFNQADPGGGLLGALGAGVSGVAELPVAKQLLGTAGFIQNEFVKRPLGSAYLVQGDVARGRGSYLDTDLWVNAYNATRYVSTGQAAVYAGLTGVDKQGQLDPRLAEAQKAYHDNALLKASSGTMDLAVDVYADPTVIGGKYARLAKLKYLSKPMKSAADVEKYVDSAKYEKLKDYVKSAQTPEQVRQRVFAAHRGGDKAAALLWAVRTEDDLYDATFNALYGDVNSWAYLVENAPRIAAVTGRQFANHTIASAANKAGQSVKADEVVDALRETESQAFVDAIANGSGAWGAGRGTLIGQTAPRLTVTSKWRAGVHNWVTFGPQVFRGTAIYPALSRVRYALPTAKFTRFMDVNDSNSVSAFRSNLERAPFSRQQVETFVSQYGRASSPEARARIASAAEDAGFRELAGKHGFTSDEVEKVLPAINKWRIGNRRVFSTSRRFMSADVRKLAEKYVTNGRVEESDNAFFLGEDIDGAVKRGDQPSSHFHMLDEDGNNVLIPARFEIDPSKPAALSQHVDIMPMVDWRVLDTALWWARKGPLGTKAYTVINAGGQLLDTVNTVWKVTALLRPGYVWRMLSDDVMRRGTLYGSAGVLMSTSRGVKNSASNWAARFGTARDHVWANRRAGGLNATLTTEADVVDESGRLTDLERQPLGGPYEPDSDAVALSAAPGTRLREAIETTAGRDTFTKADLRRELNMGDQVANRVLQEMESRGLIETSHIKGRVVYRRSRVDPNDLHLMYQPLDYDTYDRALADGALSVDDYLAAIDSHVARGDLPGEVAMLWQGRRDGTLAPAADLDRTYRRQIVDRALRSVGRGAYSQPVWQQQFVDYVTARHRAKAPGEVGVGVVVDPATGTTPTHVQVHDFTLSRGSSVRPHPDALYDYVADNIDEILKPNNLLHAYVSPDGTLNLSVARYDGKATEPVKQTGGARIKFRTTEGKLKSMSGHDQVKVMTKRGPITFAAAFEGAEGSRFMAQASSRGPSDAWADQVADTEYARLMNETSGQKDVSPDEPHYATTWERVVNAQLYNDGVARMFLAGKSVGDVLNWMRNTNEGRRYWGRLGPWQSRPVEQIYTVKAMVDTYVPDHGDDASKALRAAVLEGKANFRQFDKLFPAKDDMPAVHGASLDVALGGPWTNMVKRGVDKVFRRLSDMPADTASRFPFFADRYQQHLSDMAPMWVERYEEAGKFMSPKAIEHIQREARERALADVKKYLYDTSAAMDMAQAGRLLVPFSGAIADSFLKWGVIAREQGVIPPVLNIWKIWTAPDRAGLVQDEDGNVKRWENGAYVWYARNPKTGEMERLDGHEPKQEYIVMQLPSGVSPETRSGAKLPAVINKETFNTFLGLPTAGPLITYPVNEFALKNPELAEKWFVRKFILPFGPSADQYKSIVPANVRGTYYWLTDGEENYRGLAQSVMQTEYTRYSLGLRAEPPTMAEVQETAQDIAGLQWKAQFFGLSTQFKSPYQPYIDYYRMLQQTDPENALARFYAEMGDEFKMMTASVSRNTAGLPASIQSAKAQQKYQDLIAKFPDLAPLIVGAEGAGAFSSAVYQAQLEQVLQPGSDEKMRKILSLQDSVSDTERRYVWLKYGKLMDAIEADMAQRGLTSLASKRAKDLRATRDKFIEEHKYWTNPQGVRDVNPWFEEYSTTDRAKMTKRLTAMAQLVLDDRLGDRDDMRGLYDYLRTRMQVRAEMDRRGFATLGSKKSSRLAAQWDTYVSGLKEQNLAFADLYNRWLVSDDMTADIIFEGGV